MYNFEKAPKCTQYLLAEVWCPWYLLGPSLGIKKKPHTRKKNPKQNKTKTPHISKHILF